MSTSFHGPHGPHRAAGLRALPWLLRGLLPLLMACAALAAQAHGFARGDIRVEHPFAPPTPGELRTGAVYLRALLNTGTGADRLLSARTPRAERVEIHRSTLDAQQVMRMRPIDALALPAGARLSLQPGADVHLMLLGLTAPLQPGERFPLTLRFERAGELEVVVWVEATSTAPPAHAH